MPIFMVHFLRIFNKKIYMKRQLFTIISLVASVLVFSQVAKTDILQDLEKSQPGNQEFAITATLKSSSRLFRRKKRNS